MPENKLIPAKYIGHDVKQLARGQGPLFNADGTRHTSNIIAHGDELMMPEREIHGFTLLHDPHMVNDPLDLGVGRRVLPEHKDLSDAELAALGYEFHMGRPDMESLEVEGSIVPVPSESIQPAEPAHEQEAPLPLVFPA